MKVKKHTLSDKDILEQSLKKPWLFSVLVEKYEKAFLRKSIGMLHSHEAAEDAVQDTFLKIYKNAHQFTLRPGASFSSWAYKILINNCYDELARRNKARQVEAFDFADLDLFGSTATDTEDGADYSYVHSILLRMPEKLSRFLRLYFFEAKSQKQIALEERMSETAVRSRIHRAKKHFKNLLTQRI